MIRTGFFGFGFAFRFATISVGDPLSSDFQVSVLQKPKCDIHGAFLGYFVTLDQEGAAVSHCYSKHSPGVGLDALLVAGISAVHDSAQYHNNSWRGLIIDALFAWLAYGEYLGWNTRIICWFSRPVMA